MRSGGRRQQDNSTGPKANRSRRDALAALLDAAVDPVVLIDARGRITAFNRAAASAFGYSADEVLGHNVALLMPAPQRESHDRSIERYLRGGEPHIIGRSREVIALRKDGSTFAAELAVGEFRLGRQRCFAGFLRDLSAREPQPLQAAAMREAEALRDELSRAGRIGALSEMASNIAHEVNQPLTAIANYASAARRFVAGGNAEPEDLAELLDKITAQAERAGKLIRDVRGLTRRRAVRREPLDCPALIQQALQLIEFELRARSLRLVLRLATELPPVLGDGVQIQQVLLNLLRNAIEAMDEFASGDFVELWAEAKAGWLQIGISDCGPGLQDEAANRWFEPFFTTKAQGLGLGLPICRSIMAAHGGTLEYRHNQRRGAEFVMKLPVAE